MSVVFTVEAACDWPGCDEYIAATWSTTKLLTVRGKRHLAAHGWSWSGSSARCPEHRGKRRPVR